MSHWVIANQKRHQPFSNRTRDKVVLGARFFSLSPRTGAGGAKPLERVTKLQIQNPKRVQGEVLPRVRGLEGRSRDYLGNSPS